MAALSGTFRSTRFVHSQDPRFNGGYEATTSTAEILIMERLGVRYEGQSKDAIRAAHEANFEYWEAKGG